jgi:hypothetical protein
MFDDDHSAMEILAHPLTVTSSAVAGLGHLLNVDVIVAITGAVAANAGTLFSAISIPAFTLAPRLAWLPEGPLTAAALVSGGIYALTLLDRAVGRITNRLEDS